MEKSVCAVISLTLITILVLPGTRPCVAGTATSRWDAHIGGMVKFDYGHTSQAVGPDSDFAQRRSGPQAENALDETGSQFWTAGETRLNLRVEGPPAWTGRTSAFVEGDFRGEFSNSSEGTFNLRHAYMKIDWARTALLIGQTWQPWGISPHLRLLKYDENGPWNRGVRIPQITLRQRVSNNLSLTGGIAGPSNVLGSGQVKNTVNNNTTTDWPDLTGELLWKTERHGKIGYRPLEFGVGGFIGSRKTEYNRVTGSPVQDQPVSSPEGVPGGSFGYETLLAWGLSVRGFVPVIPDKKAGHRAGSLAFLFAAFAGQNMMDYIAIGTDPYNRNGVPADFKASTVAGGWAQLVYYLTDKVSVSGQAAHAVSNMSRIHRANQPNAVHKADRYLINVIYDINAAIRLGMEGSYVYTAYAAPVSGLADRGSFYSIRFAAYYFF